MSTTAPAASTAPGTTAPEPATGTEGTAPAADAPAAGGAPEALTLEAALAKIAELGDKLTDVTKHSRTWEDRAKANKEARDKLDALEAEKLTNEERLQKELDELKSEKAKAEAKAERDALVAAVATEAGLPPGVLSGTTKEELEAHAASIKALMGTVKPPANDTAASGTQGTPITQAAQIKSIAGMSRAEIIQADADGRLKDLYAGK